MKHYYYVIYRFQDKTSSGFGRYEIVRDAPITTFEEIRGIEKSIEESTPFLEGVVLIAIQNYILMRTE